MSAPIAVKTVSDVVSDEVLRNLDQYSSEYRNAQPFPHIVIDNFLRRPLAEAIAAQFPRMEQMPTLFKEPMSFKAQLSDIDGKWPAYSLLFGVLQSQDFRQLIGKITAIEGLEADMSLAGGGLHQSPQTGFLDLHVDANYHPDNKALHRRVNLLIYLNSEWEPSWGGALELWSDRHNKPQNRAQSVIPLFNRAVLFSTTRTSWHGVDKLSCPNGVTRKSIALYYYTRTRPTDEVYRDSSVIWMNRSVLWKRAMYPALNLGIALLKPYAKYLRRLARRGVFDSLEKKEK